MPIAVKAAGYCHPNLRSLRKRGAGVAPSPTMGAVCKRLTRDHQGQENALMKPWRATTWSNVNVADKVRQACRGGSGTRSPGRQAVEISW